MLDKCLINDDSRILNIVQKKLKKSTQDFAESRIECVHSMEKLTEEIRKLMKREKPKEEINKLIKLEGMSETMVHLVALPNSSNNKLATPAVAKFSQKLQKPDQKCDRLDKINKKRKGTYHYLTLLFNPIIWLINYLALDALPKRLSNLVDHQTLKYRNLEDFSESHGKDNIDSTLSKLSSSRTARLLSDQGYIVQQVLFLEKKRECIIVTDCASESEAMKDIRSKIEDDRYVLHVRPLEETVEPVEFLSNGSDLHRHSNSEFTLVLEENINPAVKMTEINWTTNTMFLREEDIHPQVAKNFTNQASGHIISQELYSGGFYSLSTFHIFRDQDFFMDRLCENDLCECNGSERLRKEFRNNWKRLWGEGRCRSPKVMATFLRHLNDLITKKQIALGLVRQAGHSLQRIAVTCIVAADYQVAGLNSEEDLYDGLLMKLNYDDVSAFSGENYSTLANLPTAYNKTCSATLRTEDLRLEENSQLLCSCRTLVLADVALLNPPLLNYQSGNGVPELVYRTGIFATSHSRVLGQGQSGSVLVELSDHQKHAGAVGFLQRSHPIFLPDHKEHWYVFVSIHKQLKSLLHFNKKYMPDYPIKSELILPNSPQLNLNRPNFYVIMIWLVSILLCMVGPCLCLIFCNQ